MQWDCISISITVWMHMPTCTKMPFHNLSRVGHVNVRMHTTHTVRRWFGTCRHMHSDSDTNTDAIPLHCISIVRRVGHLTVQRHTLCTARRQLCTCRRMPSGSVGHRPAGTLLEVKSNHMQIPFLGQHRASSLLHWHTYIIRLGLEGRLSIWPRRGPAFPLVHTERCFCIRQEY